jgi:hypothetical protein
MFLKSQDYVEAEPVKVELTKTEKTALKKRIKELVPEQGEVLYKEIFDTIEQEYVKEGKHLMADDVIPLIKEVDVEWHPVVEEEVLEEKVLVVEK